MLPLLIGGLGVAALAAYAFSKSGTTAAGDPYSVNIINPINVESGQVWSIGIILPKLPTPAEWRQAIDGMTAVGNADIMGTSAMEGGTVLTVRFKRSATIPGAGSVIKVGKQEAKLAFVQQAPIAG